jgi:hypothetical protein
MQQQWPQQHPWPQQHHTQLGSNMSPSNQHYELWGSPVQPAAADAFSSMAGSWVVGSSSAGTSPVLPSATAAVPHSNLNTSSTTQQYMLQLLQAGLSVSEVLSVTSNMQLPVPTAAEGAEWAAGYSPNLLHAAGSGAYSSGTTSNPASWQPVSAASAARDEGYIRDQLLLLRQQLLQQKQEQQHFERQLSQVLIRSGSLQRDSIADLLATQLSIGSSSSGQLYNNNNQSFRAAA